MTSTRLHFADGLMAVERVQDCAPIVERCRALANETEQRGEMRLAARLPDVVVERYCNDNGITFGEFVGNPEHVRRVCNDPALAAFRVWPGRI
jgi:hypothetical protein